MTNWKRRKLVPSGRHLAIAGFLGWTVEQLVGNAPVSGGGSVSEPAAPYSVPTATEGSDHSGRGWFDGKDMTPQECELVAIFRQLSEHARDVALDDVRTARDTEKHLAEAMRQRRKTPKPAERAKD
jgi:hypothetical protein